MKPVSLLLEFGAIVNVPGHDNDTPLHDAVANNHCEVAALLLQHGADISIRCVSFHEYSGTHNLFSIETGMDSLLRIYVTLLRCMKS